MKKNERNEFTGDEEDDRYTVAMDGKTFDEVWDEAREKEKQKRMDEREARRKERRAIREQSIAEAQANADRRYERLKKRHNELLEQERRKEALIKKKLEIKQMEQNISRMKTEKYRKWGRSAKSVGKAFVELAREQKKKQQPRRRVKRRQKIKKKGYYCRKCRHRHTYSSNIGRRHRIFSEYSHR